MILPSSVRLLIQQYRIDQEQDLDLEQYVRVLDVRHRSEVLMHELASILTLRGRRL